MRSIAHGFVNSSMDWREACGFFGAFLVRLDCSPRIKRHKAIQKPLGIMSLQSSCNMELHS